MLIGHLTLASLKMRRLAVSDLTKCDALCRPQCLALVSTCTSVQIPSYSLALSMQVVVQITWAQKRKTSMLTLWHHDIRSLLILSACSTCFCQVAKLVEYAKWSYCFKIPTLLRRSYLYLFLPDWITTQATKSAANTAVSVLMLHPTRPIVIDAFTIDVWWKMQMIFKAITGSSGHAFWWERTVPHSMETVVGRWSGSLGKYQSRKRYLLRYAKVPYVT